MFCGRCRLHFSEADTAGACPNCGRAGEPTPFEGGVAARRPPVETAGRGPGGSPRRAPARRAGGTRTEDIPAGAWVKGAVVAGKYEILRRIGSGGFGAVYKVRHLHRKKLYALKVPHPEFLIDDSFRRRFEREIEALERFVHPDVATIRDSGITEDGVPYFTMDYIEGDSLKKVLAAEAPLALARAVNIARRVLQVLEVAHRSQIIHRDIKPDNILLAVEQRQETVKVLDFGVAKLLDLVGNTETLTRGTRIGTPMYMSPEQITGGDVDGRCDIFAVGIILYQALTGRHPFATDSGAERLAAAIIESHPPAPRDLRPEIPRPLANAVLRMLEKKPRRRPQTAAEALAGLPQADDLPPSPTALAAVLSLNEEAPRARLSSLVLSRITASGVQRSFLVFKSAATIGRSNDSGKGELNDFILRRLPCRSREEDPENWRLNLTISHRAASIRTEGTAVVVEPDAASRHGVLINGVRSLKTARIQSDRFHLTLGDCALELDGRRLLRTAARDPLDLSFIPPLARAAGPSTSAAGADIGYSLPSCAIDCIHLAREENQTLHEYFIVHRRLSIGAAAGAALRIRDLDGIRGEHASLIAEGGEVFLLPQAEGVRVLPESGAGTPGSAAASRREVPLAPGRLYPVIPGLFIFIGEARYHAEMPEEWMFKKV